MTSFVQTMALATYTPELRPDTDKMPLLNLANLPKTTLMRTLAYALTLRRDHGSITEANFVAWLTNRLPVTLIDGAGNIHCDLRDDDSHRTMFTAHTDTVHSSGGANPVHVDGNFWRASKDAALGADDGAGVALMCHMIEAGVPGYYLFCRGEECGGQGSSWLAKNMPTVFGTIDRAIAFDRGGYDDVITHQGGSRCCSDKFAEALALALTTDDKWFLPSEHGVYTDTAEFTRLVAECTNISVGYKNQHGDREELNVDFLQHLAQQVVLIDWDKLPVERDPRKYENKYAKYSPNTACSSLYADDDYDLRDWPAGYRTTAHDPRPDPVEVDDDYDGVLECEVLDAIDEARSGKYTWLVDLIAFSIYPDAPDIGRRYINNHKITEDVLDYAEELITEGHQAVDVLENMYETIATI